MSVICSSISEFSDLGTHKYSHFLHWITRNHFLRRKYNVVELSVLYCNVQKLYIGLYTFTILNVIIIYRKTIIRLDRINPALCIIHCTYPYFLFHHVFCTCIIHDFFSEFRLPSILLLIELQKKYYLHFVFRCVVNLWNRIIGNI